MKKIIACALVVLIAFTAVTGCAKKADAKSDKPTIRLITDATGIDDKSFNAAAWRGILAFYGDTWENQASRGKLYDVVTCQTQDKYIPNLKQASDEGYDLICVTGFTFADALGEVSKLYPNQKYMIVDVDWVSAELAKAQAKNWFDSGVYVIYSAAGGTGNGTIAQAKEYRSQGKNVWAIGVDSDQFEEGVYTDGKSAVLTSMLKRVETATTTALKAVATKTYAPGVVVLDMKADGIGFSDKNPELGADIVAKVNAAKKDIIDGKIKVYATYKEALAAKAVPEGLGAKDN